MKQIDKSYISELVLLTINIITYCTIYRIIIIIVFIQWNFLTFSSSLCLC